MKVLVYESTNFQYYSEILYWKKKNIAKENNSQNLKLYT